MSKLHIIEGFNEGFSAPFGFACSLGGHLRKRRKTIKVHSLYSSWKHVGMLLDDATKEQEKFVDEAKGKPGSQAGTNREPA